MSKEKEKLEVKLPIVTETIGSVRQPATVNFDSRTEIGAEMFRLCKEGKYSDATDLGNRLKELDAIEAQAKLESKQKALAVTTLKVRSEILRVVSRLVTDNTLEFADGVWFALDFGNMINGEYVADTRLVRQVPKATTPKAPKAPSGDITSTVDLVRANGSKVISWKGQQTNVSTIWDLIQLTRKEAGVASDLPGTGKPGKHNRPRSKQEELKKQVNDEEYVLRGKIMAT